MLKIKKNIYLKLSLKVDDTLRKAWTRHHKSKEKILGNAIEVIAKAEI